MRRRLLTLLVTTVAPAVIGYVIRTVQARRANRRADGEGPTSGS